MKLPAVITRWLTKAAVAPMSVANNPGLVSPSWFGLIREPFSGAWQANISIDSTNEILSFSGIFSPLTLIANDIGKPRVKLVLEDESGICTELRNSPFMTVLKRPNHFQNRIQFFTQWIISKLLHGNTYVLKVRDQRGMVAQMYILDPQKVTPKVAFSGDVYYTLTANPLAGLPEDVTVPASEIIHDRMNCLWHQLVGISPIYACAMSATLGRKIQRNSATFFENMSRPSGLLTAPAKISDETAARLKTAWEQNYGGGNIGRLAVLGDGLKYEAMTIPAEQSQMIQQLEWSVRDCAAALHVPLFKVGGPVPIGSTVEALQQIYYNDCLHTLFEALELCLDEGLGLPVNYFTEFDLDNLLRMDTAAMVKAEAEAVGAGIKTPNESRARMNLKPVDGGESPYLQQQYWALSQLANRKAAPDGMEPTEPAEPTIAPGADAAAKEAEAQVLKMTPAYSRAKFAEIVTRIAA